MYHSFDLLTEMVEKFDLIVTYQDDMTGEFYANNTENGGNMYFYGNPMRNRLCWADKDNLIGWDHPDINTHNFIYTRNGWNVWVNKVTNEN